MDFRVKNKNEKITKTVNYDSIQIATSINFNVCYPWTLHFMILIYDNQKYSINKFRDFDNYCVFEIIYLYSRIQYSL